MDRRTFLRTSGVVATAGLAGCPLGGGNGGQSNEPMNTDEPSNGGGSMETESGGPTVDMSNLAFAPKVLEVDAGTTVEWTNRDAVAHDVVSAQFNDGAASWDFQSETVSSGGTTTRTFDSAGAYEYYCSFHGEGTMCGVVLVGGASKAGSLPCSSGDDGGTGPGGGY